MHITYLSLTLKLPSLSFHGFGRMALGFASTSLYSPSNHGLPCLFTQSISSTLPIVSYHLKTGHRLPNQNRPVVSGES